MYSSFIAMGSAAGECITNKHGVRRPKPLTDALNTEKPFALVAKYRSDTTYLKFSDLETLPADSVTDGIAYHKDTPYRGALYSDRDIYRPDEEIKLVGVIRDVAYRSPKTSLPVTLRVSDPTSRDWKSLTTRTNPVGQFFKSTVTD